MAIINISTFSPCPLHAINNINNNAAAFNSLATPKIKSNPLPLLYLLQIHRVNIQQNSQFSKSELNSMDKSSKPKQSLPSFFKILLNPTAPKQQLPPVFVKKLFLGGGFLANSVQLKIHSGEKWRVKIENDGEDAFFFSKGWLDFVRDTNTETGDLLAFFLVNNSTFKVSIFGPNGSEKDLSFSIATTCTSDCESGKNVISSDDEEDEEDDYEDDEGRENDSKHEIENPCLLRAMRKSYFSVMRLPKYFVSESEIGSEGKKTVVRNKEGEEWEVMMRRQTGGIILCHGWSNFSRENMLKEGDICSFQYFHGDGVGRSYIQVQLVVKGARRKGRGRPPLHKSN